jgi:rod shape-determining protein MreC
MFPKKYRSIAVVFVFILAALIMISYGTKPFSDTGFLRKIVLEATVPLMSLKNNALKVLRENWNRYIFLIGLEEQNVRLRNENALLAGQLIQYREGYLEAGRLQRVLELKDQFNVTATAATVIDRDPSSVIKTLLINKGTSQGLRVGLPVLADRGIAGRITECAWHVSRVMLITDENSNVDALIQENRAHGVLQGAGSGGCQLKYIAKTEEVKEGDMVISSGMGRIFPKGILLGAVKRVDKLEGGLFQKVEVTPAVNFNKLEAVLVLVFNKGEGK